MNLASTAKAPPVAGLQLWSDSPNTYPVDVPKIDKETVVPMWWGLVLETDPKGAQFLNRTTSFGSDEIYGLGCGFVTIGAERGIDVLRQCLPSPGFGNLEMAISQPTVINMLVASGENTTFSLPASTPFQNDLADLRSIVLAINQGVTFRRSAQFEDLLDRALARRGSPRSIDDWARRLAENVTNLDD